MKFKLMWYKQTKVDNSAILGPVNCRQQFAVDKDQVYSWERILPKDYDLKGSVAKEEEKKTGHETQEA
jgi:hypothetical protein